MAAADESQQTDLLEAGTRVEVRSGYDRSWSKGFEVDSSGPNGYRLRRRSDRTLLPTTFRASDVRAERHKSMWWV
jgi:hypothetical protein